MKNFFTLFLAAFLMVTPVLIATGCSTIVNIPTANTSSEKTQNDEFRLEAICVDDSSTDRDGYKEVFLFFEVFAKETISVVTSGNMRLVIDDISYIADYSGKSNVFKEYNHSLNGLTIRAGSSGKVVAVFTVSPNSLQSGKSVTIESHNPDTHDIRFSVEKIVHYPSFDEIIKCIEPETAKGYESLSQSEEKKLIATLVQYYYTFSNGTEYYFYEDYTGKGVSGRITFSFKYRVTKKYIICESEIGTAKFEYILGPSGTITLNKL